MEENWRQLILACQPTSSVEEPIVAASGAASESDISSPKLTPVSCEHAAAAVSVLCHYLRTATALHQNLVFDSSAALFHSLQFVAAEEQADIVTLLDKLAEIHDSVALFLGSRRAHKMQTAWLHFMRPLMELEHASRASRQSALRLLLRCVASPWLLGIPAQQLTAMWQSVTATPVQESTLEVWAATLHVAAQVMHPSHCMVAVTGNAWLEAVSGHSTAAQPAGASSRKAGEAAPDSVDTRTTLSSTLTALLAAHATGTLPPPVAGSVFALACRLATHVLLALTSSAPAHFLQQGGAQETLSAFLPAGIVLRLVRASLAPLLRGDTHSTEAQCVVSLQGMQLLKTALGTAQAKGSLSKFGHLVSEEHGDILTAVLACSMLPSVHSGLVSVAADCLALLLQSSPHLSAAIAREHTTAVISTMYMCIARIFPAVMDGEVDSWSSAALQFRADFGLLHSCLLALKLWGLRGQLHLLQPTVSPATLLPLVEVLTFYEFDGGLPYASVRSQAWYGLAPGHALWEWGMQVWGPRVQSMQAEFADAGEEVVSAPVLEGTAWEQEAADWRSKHIEAAQGTAREAAASSASCDNKAAEGILQQLMVQLGGQQQQRQRHLSQDMPPQAGYEQLLKDDTQDDLDLEGGLPVEEEGYC